MAQEHAELSARHWKVTAEAISAHHQYRPAPTPTQHSTLEVTQPSSTWRPDSESVAIEPATVPSSMVVDEQSEPGTGRDRDNAAATAAANDNAAAAADAAAAAAATKVAAAARDMRQFLAATKAAAAIAAALVTCQAATRQIGQTAASNTAAHRRGASR
jgi:hypothetical protein